jgi:cytochrome c oxidase assembly protein subunit 11
MGKSLRKKAYLFSLTIAILIVSLLLIYYSSMTVNNRFVSFALVIFVTVFLLIFGFFTKTRLMRNMLLAIIAMAAFAFMLVPLYNVFCDVTGLNGKLDLAVVAAIPQGMDISRQITVEFVVTQNQEMPWEFKPKHQSLVVHPGQLASTAYYAKNTSTKTMQAQAIPSISPSKVSKYFKKVECFCFNNQKLGPGESAYLGLRFYLDPDFPKDVQRVTLAYTIFDITES